MVGQDFCGTCVVDGDGNGDGDTELPLPLSVSLAVPALLLEPSVEVGAPSNDTVQYEPVMPVPLQSHDGTPDTSVHTPSPHCTDAHAVTCSTITDISIIRIVSAVAALPGMVVLVDDAESDESAIASASPCKIASETFAGDDELLGTVVFQLVPVLEAVTLVSSRMRSCMDGAVMLTRTPGVAVTLLPYTFVTTTVTVVVLPFTGTESTWSTTCITLVALVNATPSTPKSALKEKNWYRSGSASSSSSHPTAEKLNLPKQTTTPRHPSPRKETPFSECDGFNLNRQSYLVTPAIPVPDSGDTATAPPYGAEAVHTVAVDDACTDRSGNTAYTAVSTKRYVDRGRSTLPATNA